MRLGHRDHTVNTCARTQLIERTAHATSCSIYESLQSRGIPTLGRVMTRWALRLYVMANGTVDFFNDTGGYGFISTDDGDLDDDEDVFFHMEDVGGPDLEEGTDVEFDIESSPKGPRAANVVRQ